MAPFAYKDGRLSRNIGDEALSCITPLPATGACEGMLANPLLLGSETTGTSQDFMDRPPSAREVSPKGRSLGEKNRRGWGSELSNASDATMDGCKSLPPPRNLINATKSPKFRRSKSGEPSSSADSSDSRLKSAGLQRSSSLGDLGSKPSRPKPALRHSFSMGSKESRGSSASYQSVPSSTSVPVCVSRSFLRERNSVTIQTDGPALAAFNFDELLGQGGFGQVWKGSRHSRVGLEDEKYAVKVIPVKDRRQELTRLTQELQVFERMSNPYIVKLHEVYMDEEFMYLVMDLCVGGNLREYMDTYVDESERMLRKVEFPDYVVGLPAAVIGKLLWQMLAGIAYMHYHRFAHRDIKLQNYMIKDMGVKTPVLQLVDFGLAIRWKPGKKINGVVGTPKYMAPEVLSGVYDHKCDIWSIGVVCYILSIDQSPWKESQSLNSKDPRKTMELRRAVEQDLRKAWPSCDKPKALRNLIEYMMERKVEERPSAKRLMKSSTWLKKHQQDTTSMDPSCCTIA